MNYLSGIHFKNMFVRPVQDAALLAAFASDGIVDGCAMTYAGSTLHLAPGRLIIKGRGCFVPATLDIPVTGASSGYARLLLSADMTASEDPSNFLQLPLSLEYSATLGGFDSLTRDDINNGGTVYQMVLCVVSLSAGGITGIVQTCGEAYGRGRGVSVTLPAASWTATVVDGVTVYRQTTRVDGVTASTLVTASYAYSSKAAYQAADIDCIAQGDGTLTWNAVSLPEVDIVAGVILA